jgi:hypothetical protein
LLGPLVRAALERLVREVAVAEKPSGDPLVDSLHDHTKLGGVHRASRVELDALLCSAREHAVEKRHVQAQIQIEAPAESLKERFGSPFAALDAFALGARAVAREYGIGEDPYDCTRHVLLEGLELHVLAVQSARRDVPLAAAWGERRAVDRVRLHRATRNRSFLMVCGN